MTVINTSKITLLREHKGWSQRRLAKEAGLSSPVITRLEKGHQQDFKVSVIVAVAKALDVPVDSLLNEPHQNQVPKLAPDLQAVLLLVANQPEQTQQHIAGMIRGFLSSFNA